MLLGLKRKKIMSMNLNIGVLLHKLYVFLSFLELIVALIISSPVQVNIVLPIAVFSISF